MGPLVKIEAVVSANSFAVTPFNAGMWVGVEGARFEVWRVIGLGQRIMLGTVTLTAVDIDTGALSFWPSCPFERGDEIHYRSPIKDLAFP